MFDHKEDQWAQATISFLSPTYWKPNDNPTP